VAAVASSPALASALKQLQILAVELVVKESNSKVAFKLFQRFALTEDEQPDVRPLCEATSLRWHVAAQHVDMLEGLLSRR
jgi:hypothetical protein